MSNVVEFDIKGKTFKLGFGLEVFIKLGELWGLETLEEVNERFQVFTSFSEGKTTFSNLVAMSEIIEGMVKAHPDNVNSLTAIEVRTLPMDEFQQMVMQLIQGFVKSMPKPDLEEQEAEKKPKPRAKSKSLSPGTN